MGFEYFIDEFKGFFADLFSFNKVTKALLVLLLFSYLFLWKNALQVVSWKDE